MNATCKTCGHGEQWHSQRHGCERWVGILVCHCREFVARNAEQPASVLSDDELAAIRERVHHGSILAHVPGSTLAQSQLDAQRLLAHIEHLQQRYVRTLQSLLAEAEAMCRCSDDYTRRGRTAPDCQAHDFADLIQDRLTGESETE